MLAADSDTRPDVLQRHSALSGAGAELLNSIRRPARDVSTAEFARQKRQSDQPKKMSQRSREANLPSASSVDQETADAVKDTETPDAPTTVSSAPSGDGAVPPIFTKKPKSEDSMAEDAERLLKEVSEEDDMSRESSKEWLSDSKR